MPTASKPTAQRGRPKAEKVEQPEIDYTKAPTEAELMSMLSEEAQEEMRTAKAVAATLDAKAVEDSSTAALDPISSAIREALIAQGEDASASRVAAIVKEVTGGAQKGSGRYSRTISNEEVEASRRVTAPKENGGLSLMPLDMSTQVKPLLPDGIDPYSLRLIKDPARPDHWFCSATNQVFAMPAGWIPDKGNYPEVKVVKDSLAGGATLERYAIA